VTTRVVTKGMENQQVTLPSFAYSKKTPTLCWEAYALGAYTYRFWMKNMTSRSRRSGNLYLHRQSQNYRRKMRCKLETYHRHVQLSCIAQGLLQYLTLSFRAKVWGSFRSWLRTMHPAQLPSEAVVVHARRNTLLAFLVDASDKHDFKKMLLTSADFAHCPPFQLAP
jgi:hypothetical protein